jgi:hypothetical protein
MLHLCPRKRDESMITGTKISLCSALSLFIIITTHLSFCPFCFEIGKIDRQTRSLKKV